MGGQCRYVCYAIHWYWSFEDWLYEVWLLNDWYEVFGFLCIWNFINFPSGILMNLLHSFICLSYFLRPFLIISFSGKWLWRPDFLVAIFACTKYQNSFSVQLMFRVVFDYEPTCEKHEILQNIGNLGNFWKWKLQQTEEKGRI